VPGLEQHQDRHQSGGAHGVTLEEGADNRCHTLSGFVASLGVMTTSTTAQASVRSYLDGGIRVVETARPDEGRSTLELWLRDAATERWAVRTVDSRDGIVGPPEERAWDGNAHPVELPVDVADDHLPKVTSDFDFLTGRWVVRHRRLQKRLAGCTDWDEFESTFEARTHLGGLVSIDEGALPEPSPYRGMTFRTYDVAAGEWSLHWFDSRTLQMDTAPVRGRFEAGDEGRVGVFVAEDVQEGVPVLCRFRWTVLTPRSATWEQAFSTDGGTTWETNWTMEEDRVG
jgi:hypothetical protein